MTYLYLLPFKDGVHFKLGISKTLDNRVENHNKTYDLDLDNILIVSSKTSIFILSLEQELLLMLDDPKYEKYLDGHTEIRLMKDFEKVLDYINSKDDFLGFKIEKYDGSKLKKIIYKRNERTYKRYAKIVKEITKNASQERKRLIEKEKQEKIKYLSEIKEIRKELKLTEEQVSNWLNISLEEYKEIELNGCDSITKKKIVTFLIIESNPFLYSKNESIYLLQKTRRTKEYLNDILANC